MPCDHRSKLLFVFRPLQACYQGAENRMRENRGFDLGFSTQGPERALYKPAGFGQIGAKWRQGGS